jgi:hypothetical protein
MAAQKKQQRQILLDGEALVQQHLFPFSLSVSSDDASDQAERLEMLAHVPHEVGSTHLRSTNYQVDKSIREASLASDKQWQEEEETLVFTGSNKLKVYVGTKEKPLEVSAALARVRELDETAVLTARIVLGLWNTRRADHRLSKNGSVAIRIEEVLAWRGIKKHSYLAYPNAPSSQKRYTDGYEQKYKQQVLGDLDLLASCCVKGKVTITFKGKPTNFNIHSSYLHYALVTHETLWSGETIAGVFVAPGEWINAYTDQDNFFFAEVDRKIFQLHPQNEQHELRLALFLTEKWREQGKRGQSDTPIVMANLLAASMIHVDAAHLTARFAPRIQKALNNLWEKKIIGAPPRCVSSIETTKGQWGKDWLASEWVIVPPSEVREYYETTLRPVVLPKHAPPRRKKNGTV